MLRAKGPLTTSTNQAGPSNEVHRYSKLPDKYAHRLSMYMRPPNDDITTDEFEQFGIDRLRNIETCSARNRTWEETKTLVGERLKQHLPLSANSARSIDLEKERKKDLISHFVLRLAVCRTDDLRSRFVRAEMTLFRIRWESDDTAERDAFMKSLDFDWQTVSDEEKARFRSQLLASSSHLKDLKERFDSEPFFKVHWTRVTDLVERRRVFLYRGQAYVPAREQASLVYAEYQSRLEKALELTARALPRLDEDDRLIPVLDHLSLGFLAGITTDYKANADPDAEVITWNMIDQLARQHFPLCMRHLHDTMREKKHLKHQSRLQYTLFLKGIGLPLEEALVFFRKGFSTTSDDKFNKEYKYNVQHSYGQQGSRKNYSPKSCQQILTQNLPGSGESHGCPFRHFGTNSLTAALNTCYPRLTASENRDIVKAAEDTKYHIACTRLFEASHGLEKGAGIALPGQPNEDVTHPNKYYDFSQQHAKAALPGEKGMDVDL